MSYKCISTNTFCRLLTQDDTDQRGRWKNTRRIQDTYTDVNVGYIDAKVGAAMCKGGAITYQRNPSCGITDDWILTYVVPNMLARGFNRQVCLVLGRAVLWCMFEERHAGRFEPDKVEPVMAAYRDLGERNRLPQGENPVLVSVLM